MKLVMLSLYDVKVEAYMTPFFAQSVGAGVRSVSDMVNGRGDEPPARHPEDFRVFAVGEWHDDGHVEVPPTPSLVAECVNLRTEGR